MGGGSCPLIPPDAVTARSCDCRYTAVHRETRNWLKKLTGQLCGRTGSVSSSPENPAYCAPGEQNTGQRRCVSNVWGFSWSATTMSRPRRKQGSHPDGRSTYHRNSGTYIRCVALRLYCREKTMRHYLLIAHTSISRVAVYVGSSLSMIIKNKNKT